MIFQQDIDGPVAVIGDVHGQLEKLVRIIEQLQDLPDFQERWIVFIGDLVDRGPDSKGVLDLVTTLLHEHPRTTMTCGNHELAMAGSLGLFESPPDNEWATRWLDHYSSQATFESYGATKDNLSELSSLIPDDHVHILRNAPWCIEHPDYFFVHSGLDPEMSFAKQREKLQRPDYSLRRPRWLCSKTLPFHSPPDDCQKIVVSGHARVPRVMFAKKRLLLDTTGGGKGSLSCVLLPEHQVINSDDFLAEPPRFEPAVEIADLTL